MALPVYTNDQIAAYLTTGYWGGGPYDFNIATGGTIYVDFDGFTGSKLGDYDSDGISATDQIIAMAALEAWSEATGINFQIGFGGASAPTIYFADTYSGAHAGSSGNTGLVNISPTWHTSPHTATYDNYVFQTYMHEIGHALGLGHAGNYNGTGGYEQDGTGDNHYLNDSWQASVMSYFDQYDNTWLTATYAYTITPMVADIIAIRNLYGSTYTTRTGDTTYGHGANENGDPNAMGIIGNWEFYGNNTVMVVIDDGGIDTLDFSNYSGAQTIDLREEAFSNVFGEIGTFGIARGSVIENAKGGSGADTIYGNDVGNILRGFNGVDYLYGYGGDDKLRGGLGDDHIYGGDGVDFLFGGKGLDTIEGGTGKDTIKAGGGNDIVYGGDDNDTIYGRNDNDTLYGDAGNDIIYGNKGNDILHGGNDNDKLYGNAGNDTLYGDAGNDVLSGGNGHDALYGGTGNDKLNGQDGNDAYWGGAGDDQFMFNATHTGQDTIYDFGNGLDEIIIRNGSAAGTTVSYSGNDTIFTMGSQVITVINGVLLGIDDPSDLIFI